MISASTYVCKTMAEQQSIDEYVFHGFFICSATAFAWDTFKNYFTIPFCIFA